MNLNSSETPLSLFNGADTLAASLFGVSSIRHWSAVLKLNKTGSVNFDGCAFVDRLFAQVESNWAQCLTILDRSPSSQNWRWFDPKTVISGQNRSPEVTLERAAVIAAIARGRSDWSNQIPVASGVIPGKGRRRAIDLVQQQGPARFNFIELKVKSDNPLFAAVEILQYGFIWLLSRRNRECLGYSERTIIQATDIRLSVLAPSAYYRNLQLSWLAAGLTEGLQALGERERVRLQFAFEEFPLGFSWPGSDCDAALSALCNRRER